MTTDQNEQSPEVTGDADKQISEQTPVRRRFSVDETPDGDLLVLTKGERAAIKTLIAACDTIRKRASGATQDTGLKLLPLLHELDNAYRVHDASLAAKPKKKPEK